MKHNLDLMAWLADQNAEETVTVDLTLGEWAFIIHGATWMASHLDESWTAAESRAISDAALRLRTQVGMILRRRYEQDVSAK